VPIIMACVAIGNRRSPFIPTTQCRDQARGKVNAMDMQYVTRCRAMEVGVEKSNNGVKRKADCTGDVGIHT
jgi:hypothetical protein